MSQVVHELIANVQSGAYTVSPPLDIHQGDSNSHLLLIKLRNDEGDPVEIREGSSARISFYNDTERDELVVSYAVDIVNYYRGILSYLIGPAVTQKSGRYTAYLDLSQCRCGNQCGPSISFTITVSKTHNYCPGPEDVETTITKAFYNELVHHLNDSDIHVSSADREFLNKFIPKESELEDIVDNFDEKVKEAVEEASDEITRRSFITVDFVEDLNQFTDDELVEGRLFRVNYPNHENPSELTEQDDVKPEYYVAKWHGSPDDGHYEFHITDFGGTLVWEEF